MSYAAQTRVPISKTKADIEDLLAKHGATGFGYVTEGNRALVAFNMSGPRVQLMLMIPSIDEYALTPRNSRRPAAAQQSAWEQACRQRWRALLLIIRAKLEAVESSITTLESEFLANIVLPDGVTVGQLLAPQVDEAYATGRMPPMLRAAPSTQKIDRETIIVAGLGQHATPIRLVRLFLLDVVLLCFLAAG